MEYSQNGNEFGSIVEKLKNWYENNYDIDISDFEFSFPLPRELAYYGKEEAQQVYYKLVNSKVIFIKLLGIQFNE